MRSTIMEEIPYLDMNILEPLANLMSEDQLMFLIKSLNETLDRTVSELSKENQTSEKIASLAHELKGMASNMGMAKLSAYVSQFEIQSKEVIFTDLNRIELEEIIQESQKELSLFLKKRGM